METKTFRDIRIKDATQGIVDLVFATLDVVDKDDDITEKSAITEGADVVLSAYGHKSWDGALPLGYGTIAVKGNEAVAECQFLMDTTHGRDAFLTVEALSKKGLQEWSFSLQNVKSERKNMDGKTVRVIKSVDIKEISPVLVGAGVNTRTLATKGARRKQLNSVISEALSGAGKDRWGSTGSYVYVEDFDADAGFAIFCICSDTAPERMVQVDYTIDADGVAQLGETEIEVEEITSYAPKSAKFSEHTDIALRGVKSLVEKAIERLTLRAAEGKSIAEQSEARDRLLAAVEPLTKALDDATQETPTADLAAEFLRFVASSQGVSQ